MVMLPVMKQTVQATIGGRDEYREDDLDEYKPITGISQKLVLVVVPTFGVQTSIPRTCAPADVDSA